MKKKYGLILLLSILLLACSKNDDSRNPQYRLSSHTYYEQNFATLTRHFEYDANNRLVAEEQVGTFYPNHPVNERLTYEYGTDGKIKTSLKQGELERTFERDAQGRVTLITRYVGAVVDGKLRFDYYPDRYEEKHQHANGHVYNTFKFYYSAAGQNVNKVEVYDELGGLTNTHHFEEYAPKNPFNLIHHFFGLPANNNIVFSADRDLEILQQTGGYAIKTRSVSNGVITRTDDYTLTEY